MSRLVPCSLCAESLHNERIFACKTCHEESLIQNAICARCGLTQHSGHDVISLEILSHLDKENLCYSLSSLRSNCPNNADLVDSISASLQSIKELLERTVESANEHSTRLQEAIDETSSLPFITKDYSNQVWTSVSKSGQTLKEINATLTVQANALKKCKEALENFVHSV
uniref:B box-type domain-containing protein n=1 Tax=Steinernema glaseri TaxID=37863 RepID=A0A1I7Y7S4_9BILA